MKEHYFHRESEKFVAVLDEVARRGSRGQVFDDFLTLCVSSLSGGEMEEHYLDVARRYSDGQRGKRGIDRLADLFGMLVTGMEETRADILGDIFQGGITQGHAGQYFTPESLCDLIARMLGDGDDGEGKTVSDPCCGSGRMLLAAAKVNHHRLFVRQDVDLRCVKITAINLALPSRWCLHHFVACAPSHTSLASVPKGHGDPWGIVPATAGRPRLCLSGGGHRSPLEAFAAEAQIPVHTRRQPEGLPSRPGKVYGGLGEVRLAVRQREGLLPRQEAEGG